MINRRTNPSSNQKKNENSTGIVAPSPDRGNSHGRGETTIPLYYSQQNSNRLERYPQHEQVIDGDGDSVRKGHGDDDDDKSVRRRHNGATRWKQMFGKFLIKGRSLLSSTWTKRRRISNHNTPSFLQSGIGRLIIAFAAFIIVALGSVTTYHRGISRSSNKLHEFSDQHGRVLSPFPIRLSKQRNSRRPAILSEVPLLMPRFSSGTRDTPMIVNIGVPKPSEPVDQFRYSYPNFGDLKLDAKDKKMGWPWRINVEYMDGIGDNNPHEKNKLSNTLSSTYVAFDDDERRRKKLHPRGKNSCQRTVWHRMYHPSCNTFHEVDMKYDEGDGYLSSGHYRRVFTYATGDKDDTVVLKSLRESKHDFNAELMEMIRIDALVMERLSSSPRIVDIYGHCAFSVLTEDMYEEMEFKIIEGEGYATAKQIAAWESNAVVPRDVVPRNNFTATEKLDIALAMAESISDLHGFRDGVIVHGDIQLCQFLGNKNKQLKLNDFNRAEPMLFDGTKQQQQSGNRNYQQGQGAYCGYKNGGGFGNYRAPEEDRDNYLNEELDVFSMGNNIYVLVTGLWVFYENEDDTVVQRYVKRGKFPFIDDRYRVRSYAERELISAMEQCWTNDPKDRATIFDVVKALRAAKEQNDILNLKKLKFAEKKHKVVGAAQGKTKAVPSSSGHGGR
jgi:hypothetical protein